MICKIMGVIRIRQYTPEDPVLQVDTMEFFPPPKRTALINLAFATTEHLTCEMIMPASWLRPRRADSAGYTLLQLVFLLLKRTTSLFLVAFLQ